MRIYATTAGPAGHRTLCVVRKAYPLKNTTQKNTLDLPEAEIVEGMQDLEHYRVFTNVPLVPDGHGGFLDENCLAEVVINHKRVVHLRTTADCTQPGFHMRCLDIDQCPGFLSVKKVSDKELYERALEKAQDWDIQKDFEGIKNRFLVKTENGLEEVPGSKCPVFYNPISDGLVIKPDMVDENPEVPGLMFLGYVYGADLIEGEAIYLIGRIKQKIEAEEIKKFQDFNP